MACTEYWPSHGQACMPGCVCIHARVAIVYVVIDGKRREHMPGACRVESYDTGTLFEAEMPMCCIPIDVHATSCPVRLDL